MILVFYPANFRIPILPLFLCSLHLFTNIKFHVFDMFQETNLLAMTSWILCLCVQLFSVELPDKIFYCRSAASFMRAHESSNFIADSSFIDDNVQNLRTSEVETLDKQGTTPNFRFPFGDWSSHPWSKQQQREHSVADRRFPLILELLSKHVEFFIFLVCKNYLYAKFSPSTTEK